MRAREAMINRVCACVEWSQSDACMHAWAIMRAGGKRRGKPAECMQSVRECSCSLLALAQEEEEEERNRMKRRDGF